MRAHIPHPVSRTLLSLAPAGEALTSRRMAIRVCWSGHGEAWATPLGLVVSVGRPPLVSTRTALALIGVVGHGALIVYATEF